MPMKFVIRNCQCIVVNRDNIPPLICNGKQQKKTAKRLEIDLKLLKIIIRFEECN